MKFLLIMILLFSHALSDDDYKKEHSYSKDLSYLRLNSNQKYETKILLKKYRKDIKKYRKLKKKIEKEKERVFLSNKFYNNEIEDLNTDLSIKASRVENSFLENMYKILTPRQRMKFVKYINEWEIE